MIVIMYEHWIKLFGQAPQSEVPTGAHLFLRGDEVRSLHLVCRGEIKLTRVLPNGTELTLHSASENQVLAEASLFSKSYHCDAIARETSTVATLPKSQVLEALHGSELSLQAMRQSFAQVQDLRSRIEILRLRRTADRLDAYIELKGEPRRGTWAEVADWIGVTPPAIYREIAKRRSHS